MNRRIEFIEAANNLLVGHDKSQYELMAQKMKDYIDRMVQLKADKLV